MQTYTEGAKRLDATRISLNQPSNNFKHPRPICLEITHCHTNKITLTITASRSDFRMIMKKRNSASGIKQDWVCSEKIISDAEVRCSTMQSAVIVPNPKWIIFL